MSICNPSRTPPELSASAEGRFSRRKPGKSSIKLCRPCKRIISRKPRSTSAKRLAPGHPDVLYLQGVLYLRRSKWAEAQSVLEKATQIDSKHARALAALGTALSNQGKYAAAIAPLEKSVQLSPGSWETHYTLAKAYYYHKQYPQALKTSQRALTESNGKAPEIALLVAQSLSPNGRYH